MFLRKLKQIYCYIQTNINQLQENVKIQYSEGELKFTRGTITKVADELKISRPAAFNRLKKLDEKAVKIAIRIETEIKEKKAELQKQLEEALNT